MNRCRTGNSASGMFWFDALRDIGNFGFEHSLNPLPGPVHHCNKTYPGYDNSYSKGFWVYDEVLTPGWSEMVQSKRSDFGCANNSSVSPWTDQNQWSQ